jgi:site-specific recombinase XerD
MKLATLAYRLHAFFHGWLTQQRNISPHTIKSYRDAWRPFLLFVADCKHRLVSDLVMEDLTSEKVLAFLQHVERERKITIGTRNCRLAAIRSFFRFVANHEPSAVAQCAGVLRLAERQLWHGRRPFAG